MTLQIGWPHDPAKVTRPWPHEAANWQALLEPPARAARLVAWVGSRVQAAQAAPRVVVVTVAAVERVQRVERRT